MSLLDLLLRPVRSLLSSSIRAVFEPDVRNNPTIINVNQQSDDANYKKEELFGFAPQYVVSIRRPKTDMEAQRLYNHIRTVSWYLDSIPLLGRRLPFNIGIESIIGVIPGIGDYIGLVLSLYTFMLCALFGLPLQLLAMMLFNITLDMFIGLVPIVGDALDVAFKANLRNLRLVEDHLISTKGRCNAGQFRLIFPPSNVFLPPESPQRQQQQYHQVPMPKVSNSFSGTSQRQGWSSTASPSPSMPLSNRQFVASSSSQDFHKGAMKVEEEKSSIIVPNEVYTTMRYEENGITLQQMCAALPSLGEALKQETKGERFPLWQRHCSRLQSGIQTMKERYPLGWGQCHPLQLHDFRKAIESAVVAGDKGASQRVRVGVNQHGAIQVTTFVKAEDGTGHEVRIDEQAIDQQIPTVLFQIKTTYREMYDSARLRVNATLGLSTKSDNRQSPCFDVLMRYDLQDGTRPMITESSIANVLLYDHQSDSIYTPPANELPLLSGLMRQELLSRGLIKEQELTIDRVRSDVNDKRASLYLCNALRGIIPVALVD